MDCSSMTDFQQSTAISIAKKIRNLHIGFFSSHYSQMGIICPVHQPPNIPLERPIWSFFVFSSFYLFLMREPPVKEHQGASWGKRWNWVIKKVNATNSAHCAAIIKHLEVIKGSSPKNTSFLGITWVRGRGLESVSPKSRSVLKLLTTKWSFTANLDYTQNNGISSRRKRKKLP